MHLHSVFHARLETHLGYQLTQKLAAHQVAVVSQLTTCAVQLCHVQSDLTTAESELKVTADFESMMTAESALMTNTESELRTTAEPELMTAVESELTTLVGSVQHHAHEPV